METFVIGNIPISVVQKSRTANNIFNIVVSIMIMLNNVNMGCALDLNAVKSVLKRPVGPFVGAVCQFVAMPLVMLGNNFSKSVIILPILIPQLSYGFGYALFEEPLYRLGLFVIGCSPGGTNSNFWCILLKGDINLSVTMTFLSVVLAIGKFRVSSSPLE